MSPNHLIEELVDLLGRGERSRRSRDILSRLDSDLEIETSSNKKQYSLKNLGVFFSSYFGMFDSVSIPHIAELLERNEQLPWELSPTDTLADLTRKLGAEPYESNYDELWQPGKSALISEFYFVGKSISFVHIDGLLESIFWTYSPRQPCSTSKSSEPEIDYLEEPFSRLFTEAKLLAKALLHPVTGSQHMLMAYLKSRHFKTSSRAFFASIDLAMMGDLVTASEESVPQGIKYSPVFSPRVSHSLLELSVQQTGSLSYATDVHELICRLLQDRKSTASKLVEQFDPECKALVEAGYFD